MSLVGTRPILQDELQKYELHHRASVKNGNQVLVQSLSARVKRMLSNTQMRLLF